MGGYHHTIVYYADRVYYLVYAIRQVQNRFVSPASSPQRTKGQIGKQQPTKRYQNRDCKNDAQHIHFSAFPFITTPIIRIQVRPVNAFLGFSSSSLLGFSCSKVSK